MEFKKTYTPQQALLKAASYCAYQERCYQEVAEKLAEWGIYGTDAGEIMIKLSEQNYLNEERFAKAFAGGKFRTKKWGRAKIRMELKQRNISDYFLKIAMKEIDEDVYMETLKELAAEKFSELKDANTMVRKNKTAKWLMTKGYEGDLIWNVLRTL